MNEHLERAAKLRELLASTTSMSLGEDEFVVRKLILHNLHHREHCVQALIEEIRGLKTGLLNLTQAQVTAAPKANCVRLPCWFCKTAATWPVAMMTTLVNSNKTKVLACPVCAQEIKAPEDDDWKVVPPEPPMPFPPITKTVREVFNHAEEFNQAAADHANKGVTIQPTGCRRCGGTLIADGQVCGKCGQWQPSSRRQDSIGQGAAGSKCNTPYYDCGKCGKKISLNQMKLDDSKMAVCLECYAKPVVAEKAPVPNPARLLAEAQNALNCLRWVDSILPNSKAVEAAIAGLEDIGVGS